MNKDQLERAKNLFFIALGADIVVTVLVVISDLWSVGVLKDIGAGLIVADQSTISTMEFWESFSKLIFLTMIGVGLGLVNWLYKCYRYAKEVLGASGFKNEGWVAAGWIVPIFNTFKPYQVINEIYKAGSSTYALPDGWKKERGSGLLLSWWIFWAVTHFLGWLVTKSIVKNSFRLDMTLQQTISAIELHAWFCAVFLVVSVLWFYVANELTSRLLARQSDAGRLNPASSSQQWRPNTSHSFVASQDAVSLSAFHTNTGASKSSIIPVSSIEEDHWAVALAEMEGPQRRPGIWAKAFAESDGDETKAKVAYLKVRVQQIIGLAEAEAVQQQQLKKILQKELSSRELLGSGGFDEIKIAGHTCLLLANGQGAIKWQGKYRIFSDQESMKKSAKYHNNTNIFNTYGMIDIFDCS